MQHCKSTELQYEINIKLKYTSNVKKKRNITLGLEGHMTKNKETTLEVSWGLLSALGSNRGKHNKCTETRGLWQAEGTKQGGGLDVGLEW